MPTPDNARPSFWSLLMIPGVVIAMALGDWLRGEGPFAPEIACEAGEIVSHEGVMVTRAERRADEIRLELADGSRVAIDAKHDCARPDGP